MSNRLSTMVFFLVAAFLSKPDPARRPSRAGKSARHHASSDSDQGPAAAYTAETGRIAIRDVETGEPHAYMFYTAYRVPPTGNSIWLAVTSKPGPLELIVPAGGTWPCDRHPRCEDHARLVPEFMEHQICAGLILGSG